MQPELPITSWMLFNSPCIKLDVHYYTPSSNGSGTHVTKPEKILPKDTNKLYEVFQPLVILTPDKMPSVSKHVLLASRGVPYDSCTGKKTRSRFTDAGTTAAVLQTLARTTLKDTSEGKSSQRSELQARCVTDSSFLGCNQQFGWIVGD